VKYRLLAVDVDGTLTVNRTSTKLCLRAIKALRLAERRGLNVALVSSNSLPVTVGLKKYLWLTGPAIGETGALVYLENEIHHLAEKSALQPYRDALKKFSTYVSDSWQNRFRIYDFALKIRKEYVDKAEQVYRKIKEYIESSYSWVHVNFSGYAIHLTPRGVSKGKALGYAVEKLGVSWDEVIAIGDSAMDLDFMRNAGLKIAVSNADEELKNMADIVTSKPSGFGVALAIHKLLGIA